MCKIPTQTHCKMALSMFVAMCMCSPYMLHSLAQDLRELRN